MKTKERKNTESKICIRCQYEILEKEDYIKISEFNSEEEIRKNFMHKKCWNEWCDSKGKVNEAFKMLRNLGGFMRKEGILPEEEIIIK